MRLRRLEPVIRESLRGPCAVPEGSRLLVAVSGGADSTALLLALHRLAPSFRLSLAAAHLHHGLRGAEADADLAFVETLCCRLGMPLLRARWNARLRMRRRGLTGEGGLRTLRREFLLGAARRSGARAIATAHTADDQLETVLMRLGRGTGLPGLAGMRARTGRWIKPLLAATRGDVEADLRAIGQEWREDGSNQDRTYLRNRVRLDVIPALVEAMAPGAAPARVRSRLARQSARSAAEASSAVDSLEAWARAALSRTSRIQDGEIALDSEEVRSYPFTARRTVLRLLWNRLEPSPPGLTHHHLEALGRLLATPRSGGRVLLPGGWIAERNGTLIRFRRGSTSMPLPAVALEVPGNLAWNGASFRGTWETAATALRRLEHRTPNDEWFAAEELEGPMELRLAGVDERFTPFGRRSAVRLGGFLARQGVSGSVRSRPTVLADARGILWVIGVRRSARAPVTPHTHKVLWVHAERHD